MVILAIAVIVLGTVTLVYLLNKNKQAKKQEEADMIEAADRAAAESEKLASSYVEKPVHEEILDLGLDKLVTEKPAKVKKPRKPAAKKPKVPKTK